MPDKASSMLIGELKVRAHVMTLGSGVYCLFLAKDKGILSSKEFPAVKVSLAPGERGESDNVSISSFDNEGWLNEETSALLVKVKTGPAKILVSFYDEMESDAALPRLQLLQVGGEEEQKNDLLGTKTRREEDFKEGHLLAHIQEQGDVLQPISDWIGEIGNNLWIEGFKIAVPPPLKPQDLEYQAVLGKGWLSPWVEGGEFCGSRGMSLPLLGLKVRLCGEIAQKWELKIEAAFTDGFRIDNLQERELTLESPDHAPLEAFKITFEEKSQKKTVKKASSRSKKSEKKK
ncbi:hypothetical protein FAI41_06385 [Acetobacteraceae bacterium]|nr:hypothetical protein FAI41_06385 [Acetobacteraceae bacterium]